MDIKSIMNFSSVVKPLSNLLFGISGQLIIIVLIIWIKKQTNYLIENRHLIIRFGPMRWNIPIDKIDSIRLNQTPVSCRLGASLSLKGIVIYYKRLKAIYISPVNQDRFINTLRELNTEIVIKEGMKK